jgi:hypothetical protein
MKKLLSLTLAVVLLLSLCACAPEEAPKSQLQVGFGKVNVTPTYSVGLSGTGNANVRKSIGIITYIYFTCIAVSQGEDTILMITADTLAFTEEIIPTLRSAISEVTGVRHDYIFFGATHTHSSPSPYYRTPAEAKYKTEFIAAAVQSAKLAMADRAPATMSYAKFSIPGMSFIRHYIAEDGSYAGSNFGTQELEYVSHVYDADDQMIFLNFDREEKDDVLLANWAAHPAYPNDEGLGYNMIAADFIEPFREKLGQYTGAKVAYFTGASGDVVPRSRVPSLYHGLNWKRYGDKLADLAFEHYNELKPVEDTQIRVVTQQVECTVDHELEHLLAQCEEIYDLYANKGSNAEAQSKALALGLSSRYQAGAILTRSEMGTTDPRELNAFRIGPVGFTTGTYEMASEHGMEVRAAAPFDAVFMITGNSGYIPREEAIDYHSYEGDTRRYTRETGDMLVAIYVEMLESIK